MTAGDWLRAMRCARRISQRQLAELAAIPPSTVSRIEAGKTVPSWTTFVTLAEATGYELALLHRGRPLAAVTDESDRLRDGGDRRFPAHLENGKTPDYFAVGVRHWWGWHNIAWPFTDDWVPEHMYWRRNPQQHRNGRDVDSYDFGRVWDDAT